MWIYSMIITLLVILIHFVVTKKKRSKAMVLEVILRYIFLILIGLSGVMAFTAHAFFSDKIAPQIGWAPSPFEFEVAMTNLALGVLGIVAFWVKKDFWLATVLSYVIFMLGCFVGHLVEQFLHHNYAPMNAGWGIWLGDGVMPMVILVLYVLYRFQIKNNKIN